MIRSRSDRHFRRLRIVKKLNASLHRGKNQDLEKDADWVTATDCVLSVSEILAEATGILSSNQLHTITIQVLDHRVHT